MYTSSANLSLSNSDIDSNYDNIRNNITQAADISIPTTTPYINNKLKVPWWTTECRLALTKRNRNFRHYKNHPSDETFIAFKKAQAEARRVIKSAKRTSWRNFVSKINRQTSAKDIWNTIRAISGKKCSVGARFLRIGGRMTMNPRLIANTIGHKFASNSSNTNCSETFLEHKINLELNTPNFKSH